MLAGAAAAVSQAAAAAALAPLAQANALLLAVSGGPDSTALMILAARWAQVRPSPRLEVATVNHGLRTEAASESHAVAELCQRYGLRHHALLWRGEKPASRIQERARQARYALLAQCARSVDAEIIVTAHHADDQAETVLFRLLRGSGVAGLRGMDARSPLDGLILARPLLEISKAALLATCQAEGVAFAQDPSNDDRSFARVRMRALLRDLAGEGLSAEALTRLAHRAARADQALAHCADAFNAQNAAPGAIAAALLFAQPKEIVLRVLAARIAAHGAAGAYPASLEALEELGLALEAAWRDQRRHRSNLAGVSVRLDALGFVDFSPETPRRVTKPS